MIGAVNSSHADVHKYALRSEEYKQDHKNVSNYRSKEIYEESNFASSQSQ